jgi:hypothetical protein
VMGNHDTLNNNGEARVNWRVVHLPCGCIYLYKRWCIYGEI